MSALICDICGGSLMMDVGGEFASCEYCGMKHDKRRIQQKVQEIKGTVRVEGLVQVDGIGNEQALIDYAYSFVDINISEAENTFKKVLQINPANHFAWRGLFECSWRNIVRVPSDIGVPDNYYKVNYPGEDNNTYFIVGFFGVTVSYVTVDFGYKFGSSYNIRKCYPVASEPEYGAVQPAEQYLDNAIKYAPDDYAKKYEEIKNNCIIKPQAQMLESIEKEVQRFEGLKNSVLWEHRGLCKHCGGQMGGLSKCKSCGR